MENSSHDVLVIGAGASGLVAALEIALTGRSVAVIEAKERFGGRMFTIAEDEGHIIELGAEFVHGNLLLTKSLLQKAGAKTYALGGSIWQQKGNGLQKQDGFIEDYDELETKLEVLQADKPVSLFLQEDLKEEKYKILRFHLQNYVEGYYAADTAKASTLALYEELTKGSEEQYRIEGGYRLLIDYLEKQCRERGVQFYLSQPVLQFHWKKDEVVAITEGGSFKGQKVLITVSIGVLQKEAITFSPALPHIKSAVQCLGFGHVVKIILQFESSFWKENQLSGRKNLSELMFLFSDEAIPTWWTHHPKDDAVLTGWLGGPMAEAMQFLSKEELTERAIFSLGKILHLDVVHLQQKLTKVYCYNWSADPHFGGAYAYNVVNGADGVSALQKPVEETLFFAGEGLHQGPEIGTVEGALVSGKEAAHRLIKTFAF